MAIFLKLRAGLVAGDFVEARRGLCGLKNARLIQRTGSAVVMDGFHNLRTIKIKTNARQLSSIKENQGAKEYLLKRARHFRTGSYRIPIATGSTCGVIPTFGWRVLRGGLCESTATMWNCKTARHSPHWTKNIPCRITISMMRRDSLAFSTKKRFPLIAIIQ